MRLLVALLSSAITLAGSGQGEAQLLPAGEFAARDGRPGPGVKWKVTDEQGAKLAADVTAMAQSTPIVIDYDHQTLNAEKNGQPAPAAGWITAAEWRPGKGLFATVDWTARAKAAIDAGEYRFISPVISFDKSGLVTGVLLAALVNHPALTGMDAAVSQLSTSFAHLNAPQESHMDLAQLLAALGLPATTTEAQALEHVTGLKTRSEATPGVPVAILSALALGTDATEAQALSAVATLKAPDTAMPELVRGLQSQVAALTAANVERELVSVVDAAIAAKKYAPAQRDALLGIGRKDLATLKSLVDTAPVIPGLDGQTGNKGPANEQSAALSGVGSQLLAGFGLTQEQFDKASPKAV